MLNWGPAPQKRAHRTPPIFGPCLLCPNFWMDQDTTWYGTRPRPRLHCVRWGFSSPPKGHSPNFGPMSVVAKHLVGLSSHLVRRWASAQATLCNLCYIGTQLSKKGTHPIFGPCLLCPNFWMDQHATWYRGRPRPRRHCVIARPCSLER